MSILMLALFGNSVKSQVCTGSLGDPVVNIDFGRGNSAFGNSLGSNTGYTFIANGSPNDGQYSIAKSTVGMNRDWFTVLNHTPGDADGYMMVVNANYDPGVFYETVAPVELCPNTTYEFAAWISNILISDGIKPNITLSILTLQNQVIKTFNTGNIQNGNPTWKQYGFLFTTTNATQVKIRMANNGPGGGGNDIALDDITFRACGPSITTSFPNSTGNTATICERASATYDFSADVQGSVTLQYQWQIFGNNGGWSDLPGEDSKNLKVAFNNATPGVYQYRFTAAEPGNFSTKSCRTVSPTLTVNVERQPVAQINGNSSVCLGDAIVLNVAGATGTYEWKDPNNVVFSTEQSAVINNATFAMSGTYTVTVTTLGCEAPARIDILVVPPPSPLVGNPAPEICEGGSVALSASGGLTYRWSPALGLSAINIANPIASPLKTTLYTVIVSNGSCSRTAEVNVIVHKVPVADAGPDKNIFLGRTTHLNGNALGEEVDYFWTPTVGLDDPQSLSPIASPLESTIYTLNVTSRLGCSIALDQVFVKVYDKVIIPSAFSPNGDGTNDVWNITSIDAFEKPVVKIMNRYGQLVFQSSSYLNLWDGKFKGKDVPVGVYYYIVKMAPELETLTGSVMIIR